VKRVVAIGLLLAGAAGASLLGWRSATPDAAPDVAAARPAANGALDDLERQLADERAARARLEEAVAALEERVAALAAAGTAEPGSVEPDRSDMPGSRPSGAAGFSAAAEVPGIDEQTLVAAGFSAQEAAALEERWEAFEMERLYLRDQAAREGWVGTPRFREERRALDAREAALRSEFGDDSWDWVLYAAGRPNRVVVQSVLKRSPAGEAGLRAGDVILGYAGQRVFDGRELRAATRTGRAGETVSVEILRDGAAERVFVPRGPLGVRLGTASTQPAGPAE
jgi:hypothetical protein